MPKMNGLFFSTDREIQNLKPQEKRYSVKDKLNNGLFIEVWDSGTKHGINRLATVHSPRLENNSKHI